MAPSAVGIDLSRKILSVVDQHVDTINGGCHNGVGSRARLVIRDDGNGAVGTPKEIPDGALRVLDVER
jgi:hypothetical protein